jgi:hypothetical protein
MASVIDEFERRRLQRLTDELAIELSLRGSVMYTADYVGDVDLWRRAARAAGRRLGIVVRTGVSPDGAKVWASEGP